jgi:hypothetical protein
LKRTTKNKEKGETFPLKARKAIDRQKQVLPMGMNDEGWKPQEDAERTIGKYPYASVPVREMGRPIISSLESRTSFSCGATSGGNAQGGQAKAQSPLDALQTECTNDLYLMSIGKTAKVPLIWLVREK